MLGMRFSQFDPERTRRVRLQSVRPWCGFSAYQIVKAWLGEIIGYDLTAVLGDFVGPKFLALCRKCTPRLKPRLSFVSCRVIAD
jgi:hypothetical protein